MFVLGYRNISTYYSIRMRADETSMPIIKVKMNHFHDKVNRCNKKMEKVNRLSKRIQEVLGI